MSELERLPRFKTLESYLFALRTRLFDYQVGAARHFDLSHTTVLHYERGDFKPPLGYLACLARLYVERLPRESQEVEDCRRLLLEDVKAAVGECYPDASLIQTWQQLYEIADDYMVKREPSPKPKVLRSEPTQIVDQSLAAQVSDSVTRSTQPQNLFVWGRPRTDPSCFVGRQQQTREVLSRLNNLDSSSVLGERRIGKTSFLRYVSHPDVLRRFGIDPGRYLFAFVSLREDKRPETQEGFWHAVVDELSADLQEEGLRNIINRAKASADFGSDEMTVLVDEIGRHGRRVVLLLDEFELIGGNLNFDLSFFNNLRSLAQNHPLALITASRRELIELCHSKEIASSPFFNIFAAVDLGLFSPHEADELMERGLAGTSVVFDATEKTHMKELTGRHPFLLQIACYYLFQAYQEGLAEDPRWNFVVERLHRQSGAHFQSYWDHCSQDERIALTAAATLAGIEDEGAFDATEMKRLTSHSPRVLDQLKLRALLVESDGRYAVFSPLFAEWIIQEVYDPAAEPDQGFTHWLAELRGDPELGRAIKTADRDGSANKVLSKVKPQYRDMIRRWLRNEGTSNITRLLLIGVEAIRLASHFLGF